jgi:tetratricopeptide (TPR) repeat protein
MKKTTVVAFLLLICNSLLANTLTPEINKIESQWANIHYSKNCSEQRSEYPVLLKKTQGLSKKYPKAIEFLIWEAIIISTNAAYETPFTALESLDRAKALLEFALQNKPEALEGAAFVALGTLYYMVPGWPISFGDQNKAEQLLKKALAINPHGIDPNYFYADFLLSKDNITEAEKYLKLALKAPSRPEQQYADNQLKNEALISLQKTEQRKLDSERNKFLSLFTSAKSY